MLRDVLAFIRRLVGSVRVRHTERELDEELRFHLAMEEEQLRKSGTPPADARRTATGAFGGIDQTKEVLRERRRAMWLEVSWLDWKLGARMLLKYPALTIIGGLSLAAAMAIGVVGIEVAGELLYKRLPFDDGSRIVRPARLTR